MPPPHRCSGRVSGGRRSGGERTYRYGSPSYVIPYYYSEWAFFWSQAFDLLYGYREEEEEDEPEEEKEQEAPPEVIEKMLHVEGIDLHIGDNVLQHRTQKYHVTKSEAESRQLVVRRGEEFTITIKFNKAYEPAKHDLLFKFKIGGDPRPGPPGNPGTGTYQELKLDESGMMLDDTSKWHARLVEKDGKTIVVKIRPSCQAVIGEWDFHVYTMKNGADDEDIIMHFTLDSLIIILLNPWCKDDTVYFEEDPLYPSDVDPRDEYVLNQTGFLYCGSDDRIRSKPWRFGQFDKDILHIALKVLRHAATGYIDSNFSDPVMISRMISRTVNESGDQDTKKGVLIGNWSGNYDDGVRPTSWTGTPDILRQYKDNDYGPVKYGQCWVFSGVVTTVSRALGLPCRSVTNFSSAHDSDGSNVIDKFCDSTHASHDSIWNFHVWNESWMRRPEVAGSDGWQVTDATPQEMSFGMYRLGPCSVRDVKLGRVTAPHDTAFVYAEVNADVIWWEIRDGRMIQIWIYTDRVGRCISTKIPDGKAKNSKPLDLTKNYKFPEGSEEERLAVRNAQRHGKQSYEARGVEVHEDVKLSLTKPKNVMIGQPFTISMTVTNNSLKGNMLRVKSTCISVESYMYTGNKKKRIKRLNERNFRINPKETKTFTCEVDVDDYIKHISEHLNFKAIGIVQLAGVGSREKGLYCQEVSFELVVPEINIKVPRVCRVGEDIEVKMGFKNPLAIPLTQYKIGIETENFYDYKVAQPKDAQLGANDDWVYTFKVRAHTAGSGQISAVFDSKEVVDINGFVNIDVE